MIRPLRDEVERYGHYSLAAESMYDRPFQWGSKRTGPDLARVGGKYSDDWHRDHLRDPRSVVPGSIMPNYAFLAQTDLDYRHIANNLKVQAELGVPYSKQDIANAEEDVVAQATNDSPDAADLAKRYPKANARDFDGDPTRITEADALIAYLQMLGTEVDFKLYQRQSQHPVIAMDPTYQAVAEFAQTWGLIYFVVIFAVVLVYALWPSASQKRFDDAARIPLRGGLTDGRRTNRKSTN